MAGGRLAVPGGDRLILLNNLAPGAGPPYKVVYDSQGDLATGTEVPVEGMVANEGAPRAVSIGGRNYLVADVPVSNRFVKWLLLATPAGAAQASATQQLVPRILVSAGA
ncbi:MAG: hypothetical protein J2P45_24270, partial [Candidatus Dormibacteraeota bacterium]|nr:hypothetical protein [Candidatus Dormibacteraeota bacterium]